MSDETYRKYYAAKLESAKLYQDFVVDAAWTMLGLAIVQYSSMIYQQSIGESRTGVEIKHDEKFSKTRNLWIECAEKARQRTGPYIPSGIYRTDNTWLYVIGDYDSIFFFSKTLLRGLHESGKWPLRENNTKTSEGFLLREMEATRYAAAILRPNATDKVQAVTKDLKELGIRLHEIAKANPNQPSLFGDEWEEMWNKPFDRPELVWGQKKRN